MVATHNRPHLLLNRSLPTIFSRSRPVDRLVVVNDGAQDGLAERLTDVAPGADYMKTRRTKGLAGALNTGLDHFAEVDSCIRLRAELVVTPFLRIETGQKPRRNDPPSSGTPELFMAGNPGVHGSNLIVRLDVLLEAGGFNEALPSCTDRDLLIRLCRRPGLIYATTTLPNVEHHACLDRDRLSWPGSATETAGLDMFNHIYSPPMSEKIRSAHVERAERIFLWHPRQCEKEVTRGTRASQPSDAETPPLLIGIIVDDWRIGSASRLLDDIAKRVEAEGLEPPEVPLLENRPEAASGDAMIDMVARHRSRHRMQQVDRAAMGQFMRSEGRYAGRSDMVGRVAIADARTVLQACLYHMARERRGCAVGNLDDDMRLDALIVTPAGSERFPMALGTTLRRMRATAAEICIVPYTGAAPLPAVASVRGQLVDLMWNLRRLSALPENAPVPASAPQNGRLRENRCDYYHDLSHIETDRLETPFALEPARRGESCGEALKRLAQMIPRILAGEAPCVSFSPIIGTWKPSRPARRSNAAVARSPSTPKRWPICPMQHLLSQGVTFTDGQASWKLFDRWTSMQAAKAGPVLEGLIAHEGESKALVRPISLTCTAVGGLLAMPFEHFEPWPGDHGPGLVELFADLHRADLACRNLHPKNLRVTGDVVRLIDYGADLVHLDDPQAQSIEFTRMRRRAWLCWRWWWRDDLGVLIASL